MGALVQMPKKTFGNNFFSMNDWLNSYMGCDVDKMMSGDKKEQEKHEKHLAKRNIKERKKLLEV